MDEYLDNFAAENGILRRKLQSKSEALLIITKELEQCRNERDQFKMIAEQVQNRKLLKQPSNDQVSRICSYQSLQSNSTDHILEVREQNKSLRYEIQDLKQKLRDAYGDIKVLRAGIAEGSRVCCTKDATPAHQREELVEQLEKMGARVSELESELRAARDDKQELETEREEYRAKVLRLNHHLNTLLRPPADCTRVLDLDMLIMDNKYLQEQVQQIQSEKDMALQAVVKYKSMLEKKRSKGILKLGSQNSTVVVSHRQVQELLERGTEATLDELRSVSMALLEALHDKNIALAHQKKANKILASRNIDLEQRLESGAGIARLLPDNAAQTLPSDISTDEIHVGEICQNGVTSTADILDQPNEENGFNENDNLPEDIQQLVESALKEIYEETKDN